MVYIIFNSYIQGKLAYNMFKNKNYNIMSFIDLVVPIYRRITK